MRIARVKSADRFRLRAELRLRLHIDLIRAAESIEVVHVQRSEINLTRVEDIGEIDAVRFRALAIDGRVNLRDADLKTREQPRQLRPLPPLGHRALNLRVKLFESGAVAIFNEQFE